MPADTPTHDRTPFVDPSPAATPTHLRDIGSTPWFAAHALLLLPLGLLFLFCLLFGIGSGKLGILWPDAFVVGASLAIHAAIIRARARVLTRSTPEMIRVHARRWWAGRLVSAFFLAVWFAGTESFAPSIAQLSDEAARWMPILGYGTALWVHINGYFAGTEEDTVGGGYARLVPGAMAIAIGFGVLIDFMLLRLDLGTCYFTQALVGPSRGGLEEEIGLAIYWGVFGSWWIGALLGFALFVVFSSREDSPSVGAILRRGTVITAAIVLLTVATGLVVDAALPAVPVGRTATTTAYGLAIAAAIWIGFMTKNRPAPHASQR